MVYHPLEVFDIPVRGCNISGVRKGLLLLDMNDCELK